MKIIDGMNDYYDYAGYEIDETITLDRREQDRMGRDGVEGKIQIIPDGIEIHEYELEGLQGSVPDFDTDFETYVVRPAYVAIGGMGIPTIIVGDAYFYRPSDFSYTPEDALAKIDALLARLPKDKQTHHRKSIRHLRDSCTTFLESGEKDLSPLCVGPKLITGVIYNQNFGRTASLDAYGDGRYSQNPQVIFEALLLHRTGVDAIVQAHEAHMMVAQFVGGVLNAPETVELSDTSKILKAGFDPKTSFRTRTPGADADMGM